MATIKDVADLANVSVTTVSRYFNNPKLLSVKTKSAIESAISILTYKRSSIAISMRTGITNTIALIVPDITIPYYIDIYENIKKTATEFGYVILLLTVSYDYQVLKSYLRDISLHNVDGAILCYLDDSSIINDFKSVNLKMPIALMSANIDLKDLNAVIIDVIDGINKATNHLINLGHTKIAFINGPKKSFITDLKYIGFQKSMEQAGLMIDRNYFYQGPYNYQTGYEAMTNFFSLPNPPTAIVASADDIAIGCLKYMNKYDIKVPNDISLVGFNGITVLKYFYPQITTVAQPLNDMTREVITMLISEINNKTEQKIQKVFKGSVRVGDSTGPVMK